MAKYRVKSGKHRIRIGQDKIVLRPGEEFEAEPFRMQNFMDKLERLDPDIPDPTEIPTVGLVLVHRGGGRYNVLNPTTGDYLSDKLLSREDAEGLIDSYAETDEKEIETSSVGGSEDLVREHGIHNRGGTINSNDGP